MIKDNPRVQHRLRVPIIGGGPSGLSAALEMQKLPFVEWDLYEKKPCISETGGGILLQEGTWRLLQHNGSAAHIHPDDFFQLTELEQRRNGRNGEVLYKKNIPDNIPPDRRPCRIVRAKLQTALLRNVDQRHIHVAMRLSAIKQLPDQSIQLLFQDGLVCEVDLLIGADGIWSAVRNESFMSKPVEYTGQCAYRTTIRASKVKDTIPNFPWAPTWWKHKKGVYVYTCPLGNDDFEVTVRLRRAFGPAEGPVRFGREVDLRSRLAEHSEFREFCEPVQQILELAACESTQESALFSGSRIESIVAMGNIALVGDASHPMLGNFGAGCQFGLEDVYALGRTIEWSWTTGRPVRTALEVFDAVRSPHYKRLHGVLDRYAQIKRDVQGANLSLDDDIRERVRQISDATETWMYNYRIDDVVTRALRKKEVEADDGAQKRLQQTTKRYS